MDGAPGYIYYMGKFSSIKTPDMAPANVLKRVEERWPLYLTAPDKWVDPSLSSLGNYARARSSRSRRSRRPEPTRRTTLRATRRHAALIRRLRPPAARRSAQALDVDLRRTCEPRVHLAVDDDASWRRPAGRPGSPRGRSRPGSPPLSSRNTWVSRPVWRTRTPVSSTCWSSTGAFSTSATLRSTTGAAGCCAGALVLRNGRRRGQRGRQRQATQGSSSPVSIVVSPLQRNAVDPISPPRPERGMIAAFMNP